MTHDEEDRESDFLYVVKGVAISMAVFTPLLLGMLWIIRRIVT